MTTETLTGRALDAAVAERVMGWHAIYTDRKYHDYGGGWTQHGEYSTPEECQYTPVGYWWETGDREYEAYEVSVWSPSTDCNHAAEMENAIGRRGLTAGYTDALVSITAPLLLEHAYAQLGAPAYAALWALIRATPEQRCRAALVAVGEG